MFGKSKKEVSKLPEFNVFLDSNKDTSWSYIPLGVVIKDNEEKLIGWNLYDSSSKNENAIDMIPSTSLLLVGGTGSGKQYVQKTILEHINKYPKFFQSVGLDYGYSEFCYQYYNFTGGEVTELETILESLEELQKIMMKRFEIMKQSTVNNVYKVQNTQVDYYLIKRIGYVQFDTMIQVYSGNRARSISAETLYEEIIDGAKITIDNILITSSDILKVRDYFVPKNIVFLIDNFTNIMNDDNCRFPNLIQQTLGSIVRLGKATGIFISIGCRRCTAETISTDLQNNIGTRIILGQFDDVASTLMFEKDISFQCHPEIKGRAFIKDWNDEIYETQTFIGVKAEKKFY